MGLEFFLYSKQDCHLCDKMYQQLEGLLKNKDCTCKIVKIEGDPGLEQLYGARIPVLVSNKIVISEGRLDEFILLRYLQTHLIT